MTGPVVIIGCGKSKQAGPHPAADLYTGGYIRACVAWARSVDARVIIFSALHGLIPGEQVIEPYDATWSAKAPSPRGSTVRLSTVTEQARTLGLDGPTIVLAGQDYVRRLAVATTITPTNPFAALARARWNDARTGYQHQLLLAHRGRLPEGTPT